MPKKKKTRKQKVIADARQNTHQDAMPSQPTPTYSVNAQRLTPLSTVTATPAIASSDYSYLSKELLKTVSVTVAIIIAEIILVTITKGVL